METKRPRTQLILFPDLLHGTKNKANVGIFDVFGVLVGLSDYLLMALLVVLTGAIWSRYGFIYENINLFRAVAMLLALVSGLLRYVRRGWNADIGSPIIVISFIVLAFACSVLFADSALFDAFQIFIPLVCFALLASSLGSIGDFISLIRRYINVAVFFAAISLPFYFLGSCLHVVSPTSTTLFEWDWTRSAWTYYGLYYEVQTIDIFGLSGFRNCGVFAEAPMYVFVLCSALVLSVLFDGNRTKNIILVAALITTYSTTAYIAMALLFFLKYAFDSKDHILRQVKALVIPFLLLVIAVSAWILLDDKSSTGSYGVRSDHMLACLRVFCESFPFGCGLGNTDTLSNWMSYEQGLSVGLPYLFAETGVIGVFLVFTPIAYALFTAKGELRGRLITCTVVYVWMFAVTNVMFNSMIEWFFLMVVFYGGVRASEEEAISSAVYDEDDCFAPIC